MHEALSIDIAPDLGDAQNDNIEPQDIVTEVKDEPWDTEYLDLDDRGSIKLEDGLDDAAVSTDDDEPLSVHKEKKEESGRKVHKGRKRKEIKQKVVGLEEATLDLEDKVSLIFMVDQLVKGWTPLFKSPPGCILWQYQAPYTWYEFHDLTTYTTTRAPALSAYRFYE